jgi:hypothetical protein
MWKMSGVTGSTVIDTSVRINVTLEDLDVLGNASQTSRVIALAGSTQNSTGLTLRRFQISGAPQGAITAYANNVTIEWGRILSPTADAILLSASAANGYKSGALDTVRYIEFVEPGIGGVIGDAIQTIPSANLFQGGLQINDIYVTKAAPIKQALVLSDATGGFIVERFLFESVPGGHVQIGVETLRGSLTIRNGYVREGGASNALVRFVTSSGIAADTGSKLVIRNVVHVAAQSAGLFTAASVSSAATADGAVEIENCISMAANTQGLSFSGAVSFSPGALLTWGSNASCKVRNNLLAAGAQPAVRLPAGTANNAAWRVDGNCAPGGTYTVGATSYPDLATFQAAHSAATGNLDTDPQITAAGTPMPGSPLLNQGADLGPRRDIRGFQGRKFIGAYGPARLVAE